MNKKGYVANLPFRASEPELKVLFSKAGDVMEENRVRNLKNSNELYRK